jgi:hypothetical protein
MNMVIALLWYSYAAVEVNDARLRRVATSGGIPISAAAGVLSP